jgi:hypothetical protein
MAAIMHITPIRERELRRAPMVAFLGWAAVEANRRDMELLTSSFIEEPLLETLVKTSFCSIAWVQPSQHKGTDTRTYCKSINYARTGVADWDKTYIFDIQKPHVALLSAIVSSRKLVF